MNTCLTSKPYCEFKMIDTKLATLTTTATPKELKSIKLFKRRAIELANNSLIRNGYRLSVDLQLSNVDGHSFDIESLPPKENFKALLMDFRHFWSNDEPCNFLRILNIVSYYIPEARNITKELKNMWKDALFGSLIIMVDGNQLTPNALLDLWINAEHFHNDSSKKEELDALFERLTRDFVESLLVGAVCQCCNAILRLNGMFEKLEY